MNRARGLTLLELLVVVALVATLAGLGAMVVGRALPGRELRGAAQGLANELRFTRAQAIATGREQVFRLDVDSRRWDAAGKRQGELPAAIAVVATTAREPRPVQREAVVRFFPEGAATGGRFVLRRDQAAWRVDIAWLTGEVTVSRGEGTP
jgi:general secretion pathway protein H